MRINYLSEFKITENSSVVDTTTPFKYSYYTSQSTPYVASWDGEEYTNCRREEDGSLLVIFENHKLTTGQLMVKRDYYLSDSDFSDGICNISSTEKTGIELTTQSSTTSQSQIDVIAPYIYGLSAYEIAVENGYEGSESEWLESLSMQTAIITDVESELAPNMEPNTLYIHRDLNDCFSNEVFITLSSADTRGEADEYMMIFTTLSTPPDFYYPSAISWIGSVDSSGTPVLKANTTYEVNIVGTRGVIVGW